MEIEYATTIFDLLKVRAVRTPNATAIIAPERKPLTYALLLAQVEHVARSLNAMGIGREDRVAITLSNGPELAVAFLAVGACAISAPLNPAYRESEFNFYLTNLRPKALLVQADLESPARAVARARHIPVVEVTPALEAAAGIFELAGRVEDVAVNAGMARPGDLAALLFTSGTTFRPKLVPLTRNDLCASGQRARVALWLDERDRCLNIMPLFHAHGLLAALLSSLMAGGSVVCAPGFHVPKFFEWSCQAI